MKVEIEFDYHGVRAQTRIGPTDKDGEALHVLSFSNVHVCPISKGIGTGLVKTFESMADIEGAYCAAGFFDKKTIDFYRKCGWFISDRKYADKWLASSKPLELQEGFQW